MKLKENVKPVKGIIFAGCSFTWGQGLYYYSNLPTLKEPLPDRYDPDLITPAHIAFMERHRYPRLVANHYNTFEVVQDTNGGSNESAMRFFTRLDGERNRPYYDLSEYQAIVFQLTQWQRNTFSFEVNDHKFNHSFFHSASDPEIKPHFLEYLSKTDTSVDHLIRFFIKDNLRAVKNWLLEAESNGLKTVVQTWPEEYMQYLKEDDFFMERLVTFDYKGKTFNSIYDLMNTNKNLEIKHDYENFEVPPIDHHPSMLCHKIMAESVIRKLGNLE